MTIFVPSLFGEDEKVYDFLWLDKDKSVYVLQNKMFKKDKSLYCDIGGMMNITSAFQNTKGIQIRPGFYFTETLAVELFYNHYGHSDNASYKNIEYVNSSVPFVRRFNSSFGASLVWTPFYGKINTFNKIFYFDWSFGLGISQLKAESNIDSVTVSSAQNTYKSESYTGILGKTLVRFHVNQHIHVGFGFESTWYSAYGPNKAEGKQLNINNDVLLVIGFSF